MGTKKRKKQQKKYQRIIGLITDILIYPIVIMAVFSSFIMLASKKENKVYSFLGISVVRIMSGSMTASGFDVGDMLIIRSVNTDNLRVGDDIAFYRYADVQDPSKAQLKLISDFDNLPEVTSTERVCGTKTKDDAAKAQSSVIFHKIINIYQASDGTRFFETKGTSNALADAFYIREDFVVGKDIGTPNWLRDVFSFCASPKGMIILVIMPLSILIFLQLLEIFEIINSLIIEKKVLGMEIPYDCEDSIRSDIGFDMRDFDKIYFYDIMPDDKKEDVKDFLWANIYEPITPFEKNKLEFVEAGLALYPQSREAYWEYFISNCKNATKKGKYVKNKRLADIVKSGAAKTNAEKLQTAAQTAKSTTAQNVSSAKPAANSATATTTQNTAKSTTKSTKITEAKSQTSAKASLKKNMGIDVDAAADNKAKITQNSKAKTEATKAKSDKTKTNTDTTKAKSDTAKSHTKPAKSTPKSED